MSAHRFKIQSTSIAETQVRPTWPGEVEYNRDGEQVFLRASVREFVFSGADFTTIKDAPDCEKIDIWLEENCAGSWVERWRGDFITYDVKFNETTCRATVQPNTKDDYDCFLAAWDVEQVVSTAGDVVECKPFAGVYEVGMCCTDCFLVAPVQVCATPANWCFDKTIDLGENHVICDGLQHRYRTCFHRIVGQGTPTTPPPYGTDWEHISGNDWWRCPDSSELEAGKFDQGRNFNDVLEYLITQTGCTLTLRSHIFGINATHAAPPSNVPYTFTDANFQAIQIHQKSDIKRPDATNPAQSFVWKMSLKKLLDDLWTMCQIAWKIDGGDLILEHISYFQAATGLDVSGQNIVVEYGKREGGAPNEENFKWADGDATFTTPHIGYPITYGDCGTGRKEYRLSYFSNDVYYIRTVQNQEEIADTGFCLIATEVIDGENQIIDGNNPLGWVALHENMFLHNRFFESGNMNDTPGVSFLSVKKTRNVTPFEVSVCCDDDFNPADNITTAAGVSEVQKAAVNYFDGKNNNRVKIEANI